MTHQPLDLQTYLMGRDAEYPLTAEMADNAKILIARVNLLLEVHMPELQKHYQGISSGWRPGKFNKAAGGSKRSAHLTGEAVDLKDPTGEICRMLRAREDVLQKAGLSMEHPNWTKGWCHLQTRATRNRVFIP